MAPESMDRAAMETPSPATDAERLASAVAALDQLTDWQSGPRKERRTHLDAPRDLAARLGHPERGFRAIHVTGTKGKSSTSALLEAALRRAGFRVGRYSSPHVERINERVSLDGQPVCDSVLAQSLEKTLAAAKAARAEATPGKDATWFDLMTLTAFACFSASGMEWVIVEAGIGGRLDSTNIIEAELAIITNVELEHTETLGKSRAAIATEKSGIIKPGALAVTPLGPEDEAGAAIAARTGAVGAHLFRPPLPAGKTIAERNAQLAEAALAALRARNPDDRRLAASRINEAVIRAARLPGRMERFERVIGARTVPVVLDGAHVPFNLAAVLADLKASPELSDPFACVFSCASDKDAEGLLKVLDGQAHRVFLTRAAQRSRDPQELGTIAARLGLPHMVEPSPLEAYEQALRFAAENGCWVFVTGSLYMAGAIPRPQERT